MNLTEPGSRRRSLTARLSLNRKTISLYLPLFVIACGWLLSLLTLSRMQLVERVSLVQLVEITSVKTIATLGIVLLLLHFQGDGFGSIGLGREKWKGSLMPGVIFGLIAVALEIFVLMPLARMCWPNSRGYSFIHWFEGPAVIPLWLFLACVAGLREELGRSFTLTRFEKAFERRGLILGLILQSIMFGLGHLYQGQTGTVVEVIMGFIYAFIYLRRRSCWEAVIAHSTYDMVLVGIAIIKLRANGAPH